MDRSRLILVAEDSPEDIELLRIALQRAKIENPIQVVSDGKEAMEYLVGEGKYADRAVYPFPGILFLDLKLPRVSGFEVLTWLKQHDRCKIIPVMVLTSSNLERDITEAYRLGVNCYMVKPNSLEELVNLVDLAFRFWSICAIPAFPPKC
jgi:CheY-like chemotaxis protein